MTRKFVKRSKFSFDYIKNTSKIVANYVSMVLIIRIGQRCVNFGYTYIKIGTIQRRLAWPLRKDDTHKSRSVNNFFAKMAVLIM